MTYTIDEELFAKLKMLHITPSEVIRRELRREVRRREAIHRKKMKGQIINRFSGEVLSR